MTDLQSVFATIYRDNLWNGTDSLSGPGSSRVTTANLIPPILTIIDRFKVRSVLNVGCGDDLWTPDMPSLNYPGGYLGVDVVPQALERARGFHPDRTYRMADEPWPEDIDLVICRDVLQHLSHRTGMELISRMMRGKWMLLSTYLIGSNADANDGGYHTPDLSVAPYDLGPPLFLIFDGWSYDTGQKYRDPRKFLGLW